MKPEHLIKPIEYVLDKVTLRSIFRIKPPVFSPQGAAYATLNRRMMAATVDAFLIMLLVIPFNDFIVIHVYKDVRVAPEAIQQVLEAAKTPQEANMGIFKLQWEAGMGRAFLQLVQIQYTIFAAYSFLFWHFYAATPGKLFLGLRIVDAKTGARLTDRQGFARVLAYMLSGAVFLLGFFAIGWSREKRGWHDRIAGTAVVVRARSRPPAADPSGSPAPGAAE